MPKCPTALKQNYYSTKEFKLPTTMVMPTGNSIVV